MFIHHTREFASRMCQAVTAGNRTDTVPAPEPKDSSVCLEEECGQGGGLHFSSSDIRSLRKQ